MKVVILAGGYGTRMNEETAEKPKPLIPIGNRPILWHIMKIYSHYGFNDFIICLGYKGYLIKDYFLHYNLYNNDLRVALDSNEITYETRRVENWNIQLAETGEDTMTGGRIKKIQKYTGNEPFMMTYGDGVSDVAVDELLKFHKSHGKSATVTAVRHTDRFGIMDIADNGEILRFNEKPTSDEKWINGGFFVLEPDIFDYIDGDGSVFEQDCIARLAGDGKLMAYRHCGFWKCMDVPKEKNELEKLWSTGRAPWKVWNE